MSRPYPYSLPWRAAPGGGWNAGDYPIRRAQFWELRYCGHLVATKFTAKGCAQYADWHRGVSTPPTAL